MWGVIKKAINSDLSEPLNDKLGIVNSNGDKYEPQIRQVQKLGNYFETDAYVNHGFRRVLSDNHYVYVTGGGGAQGDERRVVKFDRFTLNEISYGDTHNIITATGFTQDDEYLYVCGREGPGISRINRIEKNTLNVLNSTQIGEGHQFMGLVVDSIHVYFPSKNRVEKRNKTTLALVGATATFSDRITRSIVEDDSFIYTSFDNPNVIKKFNKSDMAEVAETTGLSVITPSMISKGDYIYACDGVKLRKINKSTMSIDETLNIGEGTTVWVSFFDDIYVFTEGSIIEIDVDTFQVKNIKRILSPIIRGGYAESDNIYFVDNAKLYLLNKNKYDFIYAYQKEEV